MVHEADQLEKLLLCLPTMFSQWPVFKLHWSQFKSGTGGLFYRGDPGRIKFKPSSAAFRLGSIYLNPKP